MATSTSSVGGLVSGLETKTIISQLMILEAQPQTRLEVALSAKQANLTSLQTLNASIAVLATKATSASRPAFWSPTQVTSSVAGVTAR